jgi:hypothetical protein
MKDWATPLPRFVRLRLDLGFGLPRLEEVSGGKFHNKERRGFGRVDNGKFNWFSIYNNEIVAQDTTKELFTSANRLIYDTETDSIISDSSKRSDAELEDLFPKLAECIDSGKNTPL